MPHRRSFLDSLERYLADPGAEKNAAMRVKEFVLSTPHCFERSNLAGHITGSAWILDPSKTSVLLTHHKAFNCWVQLGGHADGETDPLAVALREAYEESGIEGILPLSKEILDIDVHDIPSRGDVPPHTHYDIRYLLIAPHMNYVVSDESNDLAWVALKELDSYSSEKSMFRFRERWKQFISR